MRARKKNRRRADPAQKRERVKGVAGGALRVVARVLGAVVFVGGIFGGVIGIYLWATTSSTFAVTDVRVKGNDRASLEEVAPLTGIEPGANIFLVDTAAAERRITGHPWIRSAVVRRDPPRGIVIALREHEPAAVVALGSLFLADDEGTVFKQALQEDGVDLPIFSGIDPEEGEQHVRSEILRGLDLVTSWDAGGLTETLEISQLHLDPLRGAAVTAAGAGEEDVPVVVHLAEGDVEARLSRLSSLLKVLSERGERPKEVFLDNLARPQWVVARVEE